MYYIVSFPHQGRKEECASLDEVKELLVKRLNRPSSDGPASLVCGGVVSVP